MICKLLLPLSIIILSASGNDPKETFAISSQNFNRPDVPAHHKFTNVHSYKRLNRDEQEQNQFPFLETAPKKYHTMQYAPLNYESKLEDNRQQVIVDQQRYNNNQAKYTGQEPNINENKYDHLEPKSVKEDNKVSPQNYKSFVLGHNVAETDSKSGHRWTQGVIDPSANQEHKQNVKVAPPNMLYYQNTNENTAISTPGELVKAPQPQAQKLVQFQEYLPADFIPPVTRNHRKSLPYGQSLHHWLTHEKQQQTYIRPRIHLNIARSYNFANQPQQAYLSHGPQPHLAQTNLILDSH